MFKQDTAWGHTVNGSCSVVKRKGGWIRRVSIWFLQWRPVFKSSYWQPTLTFNHWAMATILPPSWRDTLTFWEIRLFIFLQWLPGVSLLVAWQLHSKKQMHPANKWVSHNTLLYENFLFLYRLYEQDITCELMSFWGASRQILPGQLFPGFMLS